MGACVSRLVVRAFIKLTKVPLVCQPLSEIFFDLLVGCLQGGCQNTSSGQTMSLEFRNRISRRRILGDALTSGIS